MINRLLIANRGEIAVRIIRACRDLQIEAVAVYSEADARALHVRLADAAVAIGPAPARESYLDGARIIAAAKAEGCQAIHPGYGFLSENADFAEAVAQAGLIFVGPPPAAMRAMGSKTAGRASAVAAGVPVAAAAPVEPGQGAPPLPLPLLIKAVGGGGGRGMRVVRSPAEWPEALSAAAREAQAAFGDARLFAEALIEDARHIEVQILADTHGQILYLGERECSIQRRHQKLIEESPSPFVDAQLRQQLGDAAVRLARAVGFVNAGTLEFLVAARRQLYFLEMNTRLQVEHPVTEAVTGLDLVAWQLRIARGEPLTLQQADIAQTGHAIEARVCAEDAAAGHLPDSGRLWRVVEPAGVRVDSGYASGDTVPRHYDSLLAKVIAHGATRDEARRRLISALRATVFEGVTTNCGFLSDVLAHPAFAAGATTTGFLAEHFGRWSPDGSPTAAPPRDPWQALRGFRLGAAAADPAPRSGDLVRARQRAVSAAGALTGDLLAPMPGLVLQVLATVGDRVAAGASLIVLEAMKMELRLSAPFDGIVTVLTCAPGQVVTKGEKLVTLEPS
jgi:3-methylcrotonyl-CoA carboxylase alpha subunit